jgi:hypothetical protein
MKKLFLSISILIISLASFSQLPNSIWNHQRYTLGNLRGTRWGADVTSTSTRYVLFDDIELQFINDSVFIHRNSLNHFRDSIFGVLNASIALKINISDSSNMLAPYARAASYYTKTQSDSRYLQSFTETDPVYSTGITNYYTKAQADGNYYPIAGGLLATGGYMGFPKLSSSPLSGSDRIFEFMDSAGFRTIRYSSNINGGYIREFIPNITANRQITWPDKNGTLATTADNISQFNNDAGYLTSIANNSITNAKMATMAAHTYKGNNTSGSANPTDLSQAQLTAELNTFTTTLKGLVPSPGSTSGNFLKDDGTWSAPPSGFSNPMTTLGDIIYENSTPTPARLAGNITNTKKFLSQTGDGVNSVAPGWNTIAVGDVPTLNQNTTGSAGSISANHIVTNANMVQMAANSFKANNTGSPADQTDITVAQAKTLLAITESDVSSLSTDLSNKQPVTTVATGLTAAGSNQSTALALSGNNSIQEVTTTASNTGVKLPTASTTSSIVVVNRGANTLTVYPASSGIINGQSANLGYLVPSGSVATFFGKDATSWYSENAFTGGDVNTSDASMALSIGANKVTNSQLAQMAANSFKANNTGSIANATDITVAQAKTLLAITEGDVSNLTTDLNAKITNSLTTLGDILYENATPAPTRLAGNITTTNKFLTQVGNSSISAAPGWNTIQTTDVPTLNQNTTGSAGSISGTNVITNTNLSQMSANSIKGNNTGGTANALDLTTAQVKTLLSIAESDVSNLTTDLGNKQPVTIAAAGLTAAGSTQGTALVLSGNNSVQEITTAAAGTGVQLPTPAASSEVTVVNRGANAIIVYPASSGVINGQSANAGYTLGVNNSVTFYAKSTSAWYTDDNFQGGDVASSDNNSSLLIGTNKVTNSQLAQMATNTIKGNNTGGTANALDLTVAQVQTLLSIVTTGRLLSIGGKQFDLSADRSWSIGVSLPGTVAQMTAASSGINTTETALLTSPSIASSQLTAGSSYRVVLYGTCTSTVANASNFRVRIGTTGGNTDAVVGVVTPTAAASGTTVPFKVTFLLTVRTTGSSGTMAGEGDLNNNGVTGVSAAADVIGTVSSITVNTTVANIISVWYVSAATTTTCTFQLGTIECIKI